MYGENGFSRIRKGATGDMRLLDGGSFLMGTDYANGFANDGEGPVREVHIDPFYIDIYAVSNAAFARFVQATQYAIEEGIDWNAN